MTYGNRFAHKFSQWRQNWLSIWFIPTIFILLFSFAPPNIAAETEVSSNSDGSAVILLYHRFGEDKLPSTSIRLDQFDAQLDYLAQNHFHVWSLSQLITALKNHSPIPDKTVVLTVDDAWESVYINAYPRLKARGWPLTVFVNTNPVDKGYKSNMTWAQMREMQQHGVEFANHSQTHDFLIQTDQESLDAWRQRVENDITGAQQRLQEELGSDTNKMKLFSYPYGEFSKPLAQLVNKMGYTAVVQNSGAVGYDSDMRALMRFPMSETYGDLESFILKINTQVLPVTHYEPFDPEVKQNPPKLTLHFATPQKGIQCFNHKGERLELHWETPLTLVIEDKMKLSPPRDRYACTQQTSNGRWRWFSHSWIIKDER
ncbi:polysaccharide deacetylase family protein [Hydrogenovibrio kuenenii]|uniref:polysaccharide deacetylase family protein n=1 Tax=Hydrogenovibrio kuenenii TaxID=63658 RepID=UPI0004633315|nr:polysaccharide deacetylase family protein [Hydrogenovibrio kuenenii]